VRADDLPPRSYSFADPPERGGRNEISFFIRKAPGGVFTEPLFAGALDGCDLVIDGPHGGFFLRTGDGQLICVAGGSGLAPLMSLLMDARKKNIKRPCILLFGARTQADLYLVDAIEGMGGDWLADFKFVPVLSEEPAVSSWRGRRGLVTEVLAEMLTAGEIPPQGRQAYMCGPPPMIDRALTILTQAGIAVSDIHFDKFSDARPQK
jgi:p-cymene monooxygenase electron transfer component